MPSNCHILGRTDAPFAIRGGLPHMARCPRASTPCKVFAVRQAVQQLILLPRMSFAGLETRGSVVLVPPQVRDTTPRFHGRNTGVRNRQESVAAAPWSRSRVPAIHRDIVLVGGSVLAGDRWRRFPAVRRE